LPSWKRAFRLYAHICTWITAYERIAKDWAFLHKRLNLFMYKLQK
jgi:hypothetical protein